MKKLALFLFVALFASCSDDSDDNDFKTSCTCYIYQERGNEKIPVGITDCSYDGRVISEAIGTRYICE